MAITAHGSTFTFTSDKGEFIGGLTRIEVAAPTAEIADMTGVSDSSDLSMLVPTGAWRGGSVSVEYIASGSPDVQTLVRGFGSLTLASTGMSVSRQVVLESASQSAAVGDVVKGSMKFLMTDYYGS